MNILRSARVLIVIGTLLGFCAGEACATTYSVTDLGVLTGADSSYGFWVNNNGQVTGNSYAFTGNISHAFLFGDGTMTDLNTLGGSSSWGYGINDAGQVTGVSNIANANIHAFLYSAGGGMTDLSTLGGSSSYGYGINNAGQVTGKSTISNGRTHVFFYSGHTMIDIHPISDTENLVDSVGNWINNAGQVTGTFGTHAYLFSIGAGTTDLGALGGSSSVGYGINDAGQVTGSSTLLNGNTHAFLYSGGQMKDLGVLGGTASYGYGINSAGQVVGQSTISSVTWHAFFYSGGKMTDLNDLIPNGSGWTLSEARGINDEGQITGNGLINGETHAFLLTPDNITPMLSVKLMRGSDAVGFYAKFKDAYDVAIDGDIIMTLALIFTETPKFTAGKDVTLSGGYDSDFDGDKGMTTLKGNLTIKGGAVTISNLKIK